MRVIKENTISLLIDVQERLFPHIHEHVTLKKNLEILLAGLKTLNVPVIVTEQYKKGLGETIDDIEVLVEQCPHAEKVAFSCCDEPGVIEKIEISTKRFVIIAGIESHICVLQTAIDLKERGFTPVVVEDCVGSRTAENKRIAMDRLRQEEVIVTSYESILFELCRKAGTDAFKTISKLVK
ncbi:isochorismatase family protein [Marinilabiliaceae bacterium JC017]|nr:isochorismatase family protein [Marinilabiliaceae bacterium JC017]